MAVEARGGLDLRAEGGSSRCHNQHAFLALSRWARGRGRGAIL